MLAGKERSPPLDADTFQHVVRAPTAIVGFAMLVVGVLASAGEYRHNTIVPSLLAQSRRARVAAAKLAAVGIAALAAASLSAAMSSATGWLLLSSREAPTADLGAGPQRTACPEVAARRGGRRIHPPRGSGGRFRGRVGRPWLGGGLLTAYALGLAALATAALVRRDQT